MNFYKGAKALKSLHRQNFDDSVVDCYPDYNQLKPAIEQLLTNQSIENIPGLLKFIKKTYYKYADDTLLNIFYDSNLFEVVIQFASSPNPDISIEALSFIIDFTYSNEDFAQQFIENRLFYLLSDIIRAFCIKTKEKNPKQEGKAGEPDESENKKIDKCLFLNLALSIFINISTFNSLYIKRIWKILREDIFNTITANGNTDSLQKCAKIIINSIEKTKDPQDEHICIMATQMLFSLLSNQDLNLIEFLLFGIIKYFDKIKQIIIKDDLFKKHSVQQLLANFYSPSNNFPEEIKILSLHLTGMFISNDFINFFQSEPLFPLMQDNNHSKLQREAFWCLDMSISKDVIVDGAAFLNFLGKKSYQNLLNCSFKSLFYAANAIIVFLEKLSFEQFMSIFNDLLLMILIKFIECEDFKIQKRALCLLSKFELTKEIIAAFVNLGGNDALNSIITANNTNSEIILLVLAFQKKNSLVWQ